jgi:hypothetical protein
MCKQLIYTEYRFLNLLILKTFVRKVYHHVNLVSSGSSKASAVCLNFDCKTESLEINNAYFSIAETKVPLSLN